VRDGWWQQVVLSRRLQPFPRSDSPASTRVSKRGVDAVADDVAAEVLCEGGEGGTEAQAAPMGVGRVEQVNIGGERATIPRAYFW
jgi:hypothetical protein